MTANGWFQIFVFLGLVLLITKPMGIFMARVFNREKTFLDPVLRPIEKLLYHVTGVNENEEMRWTEYAISLLLFSLVSMIVLYLMQRLQGYLPWNPQKFGAVTPAHVAFNTAASFTTNTNWQAYAGETTMSYFTQMAGLAYHNFMSAAAGIAIAIAFIRALPAARCRPSAISGSTWSAPRSGCCCHSPSSARLSWCRKASFRISILSPRQNSCSRCKYPN